MARTGRPPVERVTVRCAACGAELVRRKSEVDKTKSGRVFCDAKCRGQLGSKPRRGQDQPCEQCGVMFYVRPGADQRFCTKACLDDWQRRNRVVRKCDVCGGEYELKPSQAYMYRNHDRARFCSRWCMGLAKIKRPLDRLHNGKPAILDEHGYVYVWEPDHSEAWRRKGWMSEHRLVAEQMIGRPLTSDDEVHHINRIRHDNRPENLDVLDGLTHSRITAGQRQGDKELLAEYIRRFGPI